MRFMILALLFICSFLCNGLAQENQTDIERQLKELKSLVESLQQITLEQGKRIKELEGAAPAASAAPAGLQAFNPEIGVVADILGTSSEDAADSEGNDRIAAREVELIFGHYVDPYSRFDATITFSDFESPSVEEAYLTHWGMPWDIKAALGRFRPKIGKAAAVHRDALDTVDEPFVVSRYFGAEGLSRTGLELRRIFDAPFGLSSEFSFGMIEGGAGEGGTVFGSTRRIPTIYEHLKLYKDITESKNFELGLTHLIGSKDDDRNLEVNVLGLDATYIKNFSSWNKLKLQSELYALIRDEASSTADDGTVTKFRDNPFGFYGLADLRLNQRWALGTRFDYAELVDNPLANKHEMDLGYSTYLTLHQSEWARWRLQYRHTDFANGKEDDAVMLQGTFAIGVHKHKLQ